MKKREARILKRCVRSASDSIELALGYTENTSQSQTELSGDETTEELEEIKENATSLSETLGDLIQTICDILDDPGDGGGEE